MSRYHRDISYGLKKTKLYKKENPKVSSLTDIRNEIIRKMANDGLVLSNKIEVVIDDKEAFEKMSPKNIKLYQNYVEMKCDDTSFYLKCIFDTFTGIPYTNDAKNYISTFDLLRVEYNGKVINVYYRDSYDDI